MDMGHMDKAKGGRSKCGRRDGFGRRSGWGENGDNYT